MLKLLAYSAFAMTVSLSVTRPRIGPRWQIGPAQAATASVACRRPRVDVALGQFVKVGFLVTIPTLAASLLILQLW